MFGLRARACYALAKRRMRPPESSIESAEAYVDWRSEVMAHSWANFDDRLIQNKDVLDFGSGKGSLVFFLAPRGPKSVTGVELHAPSVDESRARALTLDLPEQVPVRFEVGRTDRIPVPDNSADVLCAFDVVEHVMDPSQIIAEWARVLRPGGTVLLEWCPWRSPWAPHMESLVPLPWAHVIFGEQAMFKTCEKIYDHPNYQHRTWDLNDDGSVAPNKWRNWSSFSQQGYINQLNVGPFKALAQAQGFEVSSFEHHTFQSLPAKEFIAPILMQVPVLNEYLCSYVTGQLTLRS